MAKKSGGLGLGRLGGSKKPGAKGDGFGGKKGKTPGAGIMRGNQPKLK